MTRSDTLQIIYRYLQATVFLAIAVGLLTALSAFQGCATKDGKISIDPAFMDTMAMDLGYVAYRTVPDAKIPLDTVCAITDLSDPIALQRELTALMQRIWVSANDTDSAIVVLTINNLVGLIKLQATPTPELAEQWKNTAKSLCTGVSLAKRGQ